MNKIHFNVQKPHFLLFADIYLLFAVSCTVAQSQMSLVNTMMHYTIQSKCPIHSDLIM